MRIKITDNVSSLMVTVLLMWLGIPLALGQTQEPEANPTLNTPKDAETQVDPRLNSPRATMRTFLTAMFAAKQGEGEVSEATICLDLTHVDPLARSSLGVSAAEDLMFCIDRLEYVDYETIPDNPSGDLWVFSKQRFMHSGKKVLAEIAIGRMADGTWKFTHDTLTTIGAFREHLRGQPLADGVVELETWRSRLESDFPTLTNRVFLLANWQWVVLVVFIILAVVLERIVVTIIRTLVEKWLRKQRLAVRDRVRRYFATPFGLITFVGVLCLGLLTMHLDLPALSFLLRLGTVILVFGLVWIVWNLLEVGAGYFNQLAEKSENRIDDLLVPLIHKSLRVLVLAVGILFLAQSMGRDIGALLATLGLGGLAVALAAKDTLANIFGSVTVLADRPFQIGDWVVFGDVEGTVEEVGFRSTRIRTFYDSLITVPNSNLTNKAVDNYGCRRYRRFSTHLSIAYDTPAEKVEAFCEGIRQLILAYRWTRKDYFHVYLNQMGASSLEILLYVFWDVPSWNDELNERHRLLLDILRLGRKLGVEFAYPTQTLHVYSEEKKALGTVDPESHAVGKRTALEIAGEPLTMSRARSGTRGDDFPEDERSL